MAQSVSALSPSSYITKPANVTNPVFCYSFPCFPKQAASSCHYRPIKLKAMAASADGESRDNLDHLQRARVQQNQQPPQPRRRVAQVAPLGLWDRFPNAKTVQQMMDTMERLIEDPFTTYNNQLWAASPPPSQNEASSYNKGRTPWEIKESESEYRMRFDVPGMTKDDVKVYVEDKMLVVKAEKVADISKDGDANGEEKEEKAAEEWFGKSYGRYFSRIALPENVELEKINAQVKDGVLYIAVPKVAGAGNKILDINVQ